MEGEYAPTIIQLILSTDLTVIQLKDLHLILHISQQSPTMYGDLRNWHKKTNSIVKGTLEKKLRQIGELGLEPFIAKALSDLLANQWTKFLTVSR